MQLVDGRLIHSASDLNAFTECVHLMACKRRVAMGQELLPAYEDDTAELLARKGEEHEARHLARLRERYGDRLIAFDDRPVPSRAGYEAAEAQSIAAMQRGAPVIYQATFFDGTFLGRADFLLKVDRPSARWAWSYEVVDTKLALSPKPYFLVQLCHYSEHIARIQGSSPANAAIVLGSGETRSFRVDDYAAYYRQLKASYLAGVERGDDVYPFECAHCERCVWRVACAQRRDTDDHLSLVAGIRRDQIRKLETAGVATLGALAGAADALRPKRLAAESFTNLRAQAAEQHRYRSVRKTGAPGQHSYTFREPDDPTAGFARLPEPNAGDIFFDMEGDPMYRPDRALEYLFGVYLPEDAYIPFWGTSPSAERHAFESFIDFVVARQAQYPNLHVYHYAPYETTALKRLMGRFGSREAEVDAFLRAGTFVDLYPVVKQSIWISQPSYSIKKVEALYGYVRTTQTLRGDDSIVQFESWLESQDPAILEDIRAYNEDDCRSTFALREWLVRLRAERNALLTTPIPWRAAPADTRSTQTAERSELEIELLQGLAEPDSLADLRARNEKTRARWLLGNLLQYHRREQKPEWWEHFHRLDHPGELIDVDRKSLGGLQYRADVAPYQLGNRDQTFVHTFRFPEQEHDMSVGSKPLDAATGKGVGEIVTLDDAKGELQIKLARALASEPSRLKALIPEKPLDDKKKRAVIEQIARAYVAGTLERDNPATFALLLTRVPELRDRPRGARVQPERLTKEALSNVVRALDNSYLVVQGPPGSGKTTMGAHTIVDLLADGKRIALAAQSHKALHNLLRKVELTAAERGVNFRGCHKSSPSNVGSGYLSDLDPALVFDTPKSDVYAGCALVSATTFAWADTNNTNTFDVVVIDEAGQISLADALITSTIARNVVLLGDPQQLPQVLQGSHPTGTDQSILEHLLGTDATVRVDRGIFLDRSYRMHPAIDEFVSDAFYDGRLEADPLNAANCVTMAGVITAGPQSIALEHDGNTRRSYEEAELIVDRILQLLTDGTVTIRDRPTRPVEPGDILVVTPYNMQRALISDRLRQHGLGAIGVGTVDKFQGQEAPIVFYSLTTSSAELAPRGLDFLLSPNRLNVAVSRAQAVSTLVCSPGLLASRATTIEHMRLLNLLCMYREAALAGEKPYPFRTAGTQLELLMTT